MTLSVVHDNIIPTPPFLGTHCLTDISLGTIVPFINMRILGDFLWDISDEAQAKKILNRLVIKNKQEQIIQLQAIYGYFYCQSDNDVLIVYDEKKREAARFRFPRVLSHERVGIADFFRSQAGHEFDVVALQLVTVGRHAAVYTKKLFKAHQYQDYFYWKGLCAAAANALAEFVHKTIRVEWGFVEEEPTDMQDIFRKKYRGTRYSFGYPACPNLEDQKKLLHLLDAERIGVTLSATFQLNPEESTSAIVVHHPRAKQM